MAFCRLGSQLPARGAAPTRSARPSAAQRAKQPQCWGMEASVAVAPPADSGLPQLDYDSPSASPRLSASGAAAVSPNRTHAPSHAAALALFGVLAAPAPVDPSSVASMLQERARMQPWMTELVSHKAAPAPPPATPAQPSSARRPAPRHAAIPAPYIPAELQRYVVTSLDHLLTDVAKARTEGRLHATVYVSEAGWKRFGKEIKSMMGADGFGPSGLVRFGLVPLGPRFAERAAELSASGCLVKPGEIDRADVAARLGIDVALATFAYGTHGNVSSYMPYCPALVVRGTCHGATGSRHAGHVAEIAEPSPPWSMRQDLDDHVRRHRTSLAAAKAKAAEAASLDKASAKVAPGDLVVDVAVEPGAAASTSKGPKQVSYELA